MDNRGKIYILRVVAIAALLLPVWASPGSALAHAKLVSSIPAAGSSVKIGLTQIVLNFGEEISVDKSTGELDGPNGGAMTGATRVVDRIDRKKMIITTPPLASGTYTVKWKSVTEDDNGIVNGSFTFKVTENAPETGATPGTIETGGQGGTASSSLPVSSVPGSPVMPVILTLAVVGLLALVVAIVRRAARQA